MLGLKIKVKGTQLLWHSAPYFSLIPSPSKLDTAVILVARPVTRVPQTVRRTTRRSTERHKNNGENLLICKLEFGIYLGVSTFWAYEPIHFLILGSIPFSRYIIIAAHFNQLNISIMYYSPDNDGRIQWSSMVTWQTEVSGGLSSQDQDLLHSPLTTREDIPTQPGRPGAVWRVSWFY